MKTFKEFIAENINVGQHKFIVDPNYDNHNASLHLFNVDKVEQSFSKDKDQYIEKGGTGAGIIKDRYPRVQDYIKHNKVINASSVGVDKEGSITFANGRHRYSAFRDMGVKQIPMSLHSNADRRNAKKFGYID